MEALGLSIWVLLGYPTLFLLGWLASRIDYVQLKLENRESPKAYFKGLNLLLDEQQDEAIDAFIEAVQNDPDTSDLHFALGGLFRKRGEFHRAIRIHKHLLLRGELSTHDRARAQFALAQDYLKAGIINLAQEALEQLIGSSYEIEARRSLLGIYERSRDWEKAGNMAATLRTQLASVDNPLLTSLQKSVQAELLVNKHMHFMCEASKTAFLKNDIQASEDFLQQAEAVNPTHPRTAFERSLLLEHKGQLELAYQHLVDFIQNQPTTTPYLVERLVSLAKKTERVLELKVLLQAQYQLSPSIKILVSLCALETDTNAVKALWRTHLTNSNSILAAHSWLRLQFGDVLDDLHTPQVLNAIETADSPLMRYRCTSCGFETKDFFWQCPGCLNWDSYPPLTIGDVLM